MTRYREPTEQLQRGGRVLPMVDAATRPGLFDDEQDLADAMDRHPAGSRQHPPQPRLGGQVFVPGVPAPKGSAKAYVRGGRAVVTHDNENTMPWQTHVSAMVAAEIGTQLLYPTGPVRLGMLFIMPRLAAQPKTKPTVPHMVKPDLDKLARCILDALTGLVYRDDGQVDKFFELAKRRAEPAEQTGAWIGWLQP